MKNIGWSAPWLALSIFAVVAMTAAQPAPAEGAPEESRFQLPGSGQTVKGQIMLLAIDDRALPFRSNLVCYLSKPTVLAKPVLGPSRDNPQAPDYVAAHFFGTVLLDAGKFRMWYYACHANPEFNGVILGPICYAESPDGIHWSKPTLGQVEFHGSRENNIVALETGPDGQTECVGVLKDEDDPDPERRYKMVYLPQHPDKRYDWSLRTATSADGLHWKAGPPGAIPAFMEFSGYYHHAGLYVVNAHTYERGEGGRMQGREGYAWVSTDFNSWLPEAAPSFALAEPLVGSGYGGAYVQDHEGVAGVDFGNVVVGLYCRWHQTRPLPNGQPDWEGRFSDLGLALSQDGIHFYEPVRDWIFISHSDSPSTPVPGRPYHTILLPSSSIIDYGDQTLIYHGRWRNVDPYGRNSRALDYYGEVGLATLPRDRWGSLALRPALPPPSPGTAMSLAHRETLKAADQGSVWSEPIHLPSDRNTEVWLNADGSDALRVEIGDEQFSLLPDFSAGKNGRPASSHGLDCQVKWAGGDLGALRGRTVRLRISFSRAGAPDPRLYAVYLRTRSI